SNTGFNDILLLEKASYIGKLVLSNNGLTNEDMNKVFLLADSALYNLLDVDVSNNNITSLEFLETYNREDVYISNLSYIFDNIDFSTLNVDVLDSIENSDISMLFLSLNSCNIHDLSTFEDKKVWLYFTIRIKF
ncbi:MAG: hypothetical protein ACK5LC_02475, partial [Coprobacillaceae bacterium]